jgi:hypothetical protein
VIRQVGDEKELDPRQQPVDPVFEEVAEMDVGALDVPVRLADRVYPAEDAQGRLGHGGEPSVEKRRLLAFEEEKAQAVFARIEGAGVEQPEVEPAHTEAFQAQQRVRGVRRFRLVRHAAPRRRFDQPAMVFGDIAADQDAAGEFLVEEADEGPVRQALRAVRGEEFRKPGAHPRPLRPPRLMALRQRTEEGQQLVLYVPSGAPPLPGHDYGTHRKYQQEAARLLRSRATVRKEA